jgi:hypothetical protein
MGRIVVAIALAIFASASGEIANAAPNRSATSSAICVSAKTGGVVGRSGKRCRKNETKLNLSSISIEGEPGPQGPQGAPGLVGIEMLFTEIPVSFLGSGFGAGNPAFCPTGKVAVGGGCSSSVSSLSVQSSIPSNFVGSLPTSWSCVMLNNTSAPINNAKIITWVTCASGA